MKRLCQAILTAVALLALAAMVNNTTPIIPTPFQSCSQILKGK